MICQPDSAKRADQDYHPNKPEWLGAVSGKTECYPDSYTNFLQDFRASNSSYPSLHKVASTASDFR